MTADSFLSMLRPCAAGRAAVLVIFAFCIETLPALVPTRTPVYGLIGASHAWRRAGVPTATALPQRPSSSQQQEQQEQQQPADVRSGSVAIIFRQASPYDFPDVGALRTAVFAPHLTMAQSRRLQNSIFERAMAAKEFVVLAEAKQRDGSSEVIGAADLAVFSLPDGPYRKRLAGYITNVAVSPRAQRLGVGRGLLTTLCARRPAASSSFNRPNDATRLVADLAVRPMPHAPRSPNPRPPAHDPVRTTTERHTRATTASPRSACTWTRPTWRRCGCTAAQVSPRTAPRRTTPSTTPWRERTASSCTSARGGRCSC